MIREIERGELVMTDLNRRFAKLAGVEYTGQNFYDRKEVLRVMKARDDWEEFCGVMSWAVGGEIGLIDVATKWLEER
jgi:hypothetical protein